MIQHIRALLFGDNLPPADKELPDHAQRQGPAAPNGGTYIVSMTSRRLTSPDNEYRLSTQLGRTIEAMLLPTAVSEPGPPHGDGK